MKDSLAKFLKIEKPDFTKLEWFSYVGLLILEVGLVFVIFNISNTTDKEEFLSTILKISLIILGISVGYTIILDRIYSRHIRGIAQNIELRVKDLESSIKDGKTDIEKLTRKTKDYIDYAKNHHITIVTSSKELTISKDLMEKGQCKVHHMMKIRNNGSHPFMKYIYSVSSTEKLSPHDYYEFRLDDGRPLDKSDVKYQHESTTINGGEPSNGYEVSIPVDVGSRKTRKLDIIENKCPSFPKLNECMKEGGKAEDEWMSIVINYPTDVLKFTISLDESMKGYQLIQKKHYKINTPSLMQDSYETSNEYLVLDKSEQQVKYEQDALPAWKAIPEYTPWGNGIEGYRSVTWEVHYPKIGYKYQLYFTLSKIGCDK